MLEVKRSGGGSGGVCIGGVEGGRGDNRKSVGMRDEKRKKDGSKKKIINRRKKESGNKGRKEIEGKKVENEIGGMKEEKKGMER